MLLSQFQLGSSRFIYLISPGLLEPWHSQRTGQLWNDPPPLGSVLFLHYHIEVVRFSQETPEVTGLSHCGALRFRDSEMPHYRALYPDFRQDGVCSFLHHKDTDCPLQLIHIFRSCDASLSPYVVTRAIVW